MFPIVFGTQFGQPRTGAGGKGGPGGASPAPFRPSGAFASAQKIPQQSVIVVIAAHHSVALDRVAERMPRGTDRTVEVIVACAGQPSHATVTAVHAYLRTAQFLLAPAETTERDLRALAISQATGDIVSLVDGVLTGAAESGVEARSHHAAALNVSIVVPVHNEAALLNDALAAIDASDLPRDTYEIIVVDDGSSDGSLEIAARYADTIVRLKGDARGAAYARNRGADLARGDIVAFVDADVRVQRDTVSRLMSTLDEDVRVCAVGASSDGTSGDGGVPTQYWNLLQQFGAQSRSGFGIHFKASCGAVRRDVFREVGMYNEWVYRGASVEDLDLGRRLQKTGQLVLFRADAAVSHRRSHSLRDVLATTWRRSSLLTRTLSYRGTRSLARSDVIHTLDSTKGFVAAGVTGMLVYTALSPRPATFIASGVAVVALLALNFRALGFFAQRRGLTFAIAAAPLHIVVQIVAVAGRCSGWLLRNLVGDPSPDPTTQAFAEVGVEVWPPVPRKL